MMTLYHFPLCAKSRAARLALGEWGFAFNASEVKPWAVGREFLALNPAGDLPVLAVDGRAVCGIGPLAEFVNESLSSGGPGGGRSPVWTGSPSDRAEQRRVADWFLHKFDDEVTQFLMCEKVINPLRGDRAPPHLPGMRAARENLRYHLSYISYLSEQRKWLGGATLSFADFAAAAQLSVMDYLSEIPWNDYPECKAWYARLKSRPAFRSLLADRLPGYAPPKFYADLDF